jgi:hypothetical protein
VTLTQRVERAIASHRFISNTKQEEYMYIGLGGILILILILWLLGVI